MQINNQTPWAENGGDKYISVHSCWYTIQGEGPLTGMPAVFLRLAGCNLKCPGCDTDYTSNCQELWVEEVIEQKLIPAAHAMMSKGVYPIVVITGGEPFRQGGLQRLVEAILETPFFPTVQIETNGTLWNPHFHLDTWKDLAECYRLQIVVSPKTQHVRPEIAEIATAYKYVLSVGAVDPKDGLPRGVLGMRHPPARPPAGFPVEKVYVQPSDQKDDKLNAASTQVAVQSSMEFGYRFCLQIQKLIGVD